MGGRYMKRYPTIEWQVAGACNYDCSYCIQSKKYRKGRPKLAQLEKAMDFFAALAGQWEIKCSGGEAFAHRLFMSYIVPQLIHSLQRDQEPVERRSQHSYSVSMN